MSSSVDVQQLQILQAIPQFLTLLLHVLHHLVLLPNLREAQPLLSLREAQPLLSLREAQPLLSIRLPLLRDLFSYYWLLRFLFKF